VEGAVAVCRRFGYNDGVTTAVLPAKRDVARALLLRGSLFVHLDPRRRAVVVPARLRAQPQVVLQVGLHMPVPIPDLRIDEDGVFGTLSFKGVPFTCFVPWQAVFALVGEDGKGMVWSTEVPQEIARELEREKGKAASGGDAALVHLDAFRSSAARGRAPSVRRRSDRAPDWPPYLRLVK
jgi:stringent starvation protein B